MPEPAPRSMRHRLATFADLALGRRATFRRTVTEAEVELFVALTGDTNPLHVDAAFAERTFFGGRIAHGMLSASLLSTVVGTLLPGTGAIYRSQSLTFLRPVHLGDTLTAGAEVTALDPANNRIELATWIDNQDGTRVIEGTAVVSLLRDRRGSG